MKTDPNPQGKGLVPVLESLESSRPEIDAIPKHIDRIAGELFTSMFVLKSEFGFRPVAGKTYYLYRKEGRFRLSLIGPDQWYGGLFGRFIGECRMEPDITWTIEMDKSAARDKELIQYIHGKKKEFEQSLENAEKLEDMLPVYLEALPFYQRLFASALAHSLGTSMGLSGIRTLTYHEAKGLLCFNEENPGL